MRIQIRWRRQLWRCCYIAALAAASQWRPVAAQQTAVDDDDNYATSGNPVPLSPAAAQAVLQTLFVATGGPAWTNASGWAEAGADACAYFGVTCYPSDPYDNQQARAGQIRALDLPDNNLVGTLPASVFALPFLERLVLRGNGDLRVSLAGDGSGNWLAQAQALKVLDISSTWVESLDGVEQARRLEELYIASLQLTGPIPTSLYQMTSLKGLYANYNSFSGPLGMAIGNLEALQELYLSGNDLTGQLPSTLGKLSNLVVLALGQNAFGGSLPLALNKLTNLEVLALHRVAGQEKGPGISYRLPSLANLDKIAEIYLQNQQLTGTIPSDFLKGAPATDLVVVDLFSNNIEGTIPAALTSKQRLNLFLGDNRIQSVTQDLCSRVPGWMDNDVATLGCTALLCSPGSWAPEGRATNGNSCDTCDTAYLWGTTECEPDTAQGEAVDQRDVLVDFYEKMGGQYWIRSNKWNTDASVCQWEGVTCTSDSRVSGLLLRHNGLATMGSESPWTKLFTLPYLEVLDLSSNAIDFDFGAAASAAKLQVLDLSDTGLRSLENVGELASTSITKLSIASNSLTGKLLEGIFAIPTLTELDLSLNEFSGTLSDSLSRLSRLELLYISGNQFSGNLPTTIGALSSLLEFKASENKFTGSIPTQLGQLVQLQELAIENSSLSGNLPSLADLRQLTSLRLGENSLFGTLPATLLANTQKGNGEIEILLNDNSFEGEIPSVWGTRFSKLILDLSNNKITSIGDGLCSQSNWMHGTVGNLDGSCDAILCPVGTYNEFGHRTNSADACEDCNDALYMGSKTCQGESMGNEIDILRAFFSSTQGDAWLFNDGWTTTDDYCSWYGVTCDSTKSVTRIVLESNGLHGSVVSSIFALPGLVELNLAKNGIDFSFAGIGKATNLQILDVSQTGIDSLDGIGKARRLVELYASDNAMQGRFPDELFALTNLQKLYLNYNLFDGRISPEISTLASLQELYLFHNRLTGQLPGALGSLTNLRALALSENRFLGSLPPELNGLSNLELLAIQQEGGTDGSLKGDVGTTGSVDVDGPGLNGRIPSFSGLAKIKNLFLGFNSFSGSLPVDFLDGVEDKSSLIQVDLTGNYISGEVPSSLSRFDQLALYLAGNEISGIPDGICRQTGWMRGKVGNFGCSAILCGPGYYSVLGRETDSVSCSACPQDETATFYGSFECLTGAEQELEDERNILIELYQSTGGSFWEAADNWLDEDVSICEWYGVACTQDGSSVEGIILQSNGLVGSIPTSIFKLSNLEELNFQGNAVNVSFSGIGAASSLQYLNLDSTGLQSLEGIEYARRLKGLSAANNKLPPMEFPSKILALSGLQFLDLSDNSFRVEIPSSIGALRNLESFHCSRCGLVGSIPSGVGLLQNLKSIRLDLNSLYGSLPQSLQDLQLLTFIDLSNQLESGDVVQAAQFTGKNSSLELTLTYGLQGGLEPFSNLTQLSELYLQNNRFSSSIPSTFLQTTDPAALQIVDLRQNRLTGAIPSVLRRFTSLELLLADNMIESIPSQLCSLAWNGNAKTSSQSSCSHILCGSGTVNGLGYATDSTPCVACPGGASDSPYMGGTSCGSALERDILDQLFLELNGADWNNKDGWYVGSDSCSRFGVTCDSKGLILALDLRDNNLRGIVTNRIWLLNHLQELNLSDNLIEMSFESIGQLQSLKSLKLSGTYLRNLYQIGSATSLAILHIDNSLLSGSIPEEIYQLTNLRSLYLNHNQLSGTISDSIGNLAQLEQLSLSDNKLSGSLDNLYDMKTDRLVYLSLGRNNFTGTIPNSFSYFQFLEVLDLQGDDPERNGVTGQSYGLTGQLPAFQDLPKLRELNLASNSLSGAIPDSFLMHTDTAPTITVNLDGNNIIGAIPADLIKFSDLRLSVANNMIDTVPENICSMSNWFDGLIGSGCDAFLCRPGTYNMYGRRLPNENCQPCDFRGSAIYYGSTYCGMVFPQSLSEIDILSEFWEATNGPQWFNSDGWTKTSSVCDWFGITCLKDGNGKNVVTEINLANNNLQWEASSVIFYLKHLKILNLADNDVSLSFRDIHAAAALEELNFSGTRVTSLEGIGGAKRLKIIQGSRNAFYGTKLSEEIFSLTDLVMLDVSDCGFVGPLSQNIGSLKNLLVLNAENNEFSGGLPDSLFLLPKLKRILLSGNNLVGSIPSTADNSTTLETLAISARQTGTAGLSGALPSFSELSNLKTLDLRFNSLTGSIPTDFLSSIPSSASAVTVLLSHNLLTGQVPSSLSNLTSLNIDLSDNEIEAIDSSLCSMSNWWDGNVGRFGCEALLCPAGTYGTLGRQASDQIQCEICPDSASPYLGQTVCPSLQLARNREILELLYDSTGGRKWNRKDGWKETDNICEWYGITCSVDDQEGIEIESIVLGANNLVGQLPSEIFELPGLQALWLYSNPIEISFEDISKATSLTSLQLDSTKLTSLQGIGKATPLVELTVRFNNLHGPLSGEISQLTNLETLFCGESGLTGRLPSFNRNRKLSELRTGGNALTGPLPSFSVHPKLRSLDLSDNNLSGDIPDDLLAAADVSKPIFLDLSDNSLSGSIPDSLLRFPSVTIFARNNHIEGIDKSLCSMENWNEGDVALYHCDGILCPPETFSPKGRASEGETCIYCAEAAYFGSSSCPSAEYVRSSAPPRQGHGWALLVAFVSSMAGFWSLLW